MIVRRVGLRDESADFDLPVAEPQPPETVPPPDTAWRVAHCLDHLELAPRRPRLVAGVVALLARPSC